MEHAWARHVGEEAHAGWSGEAGGGRLAIEVVRSRPLDAVLLDILLPDVDGLEVLQDIKARAPRVPVIMITGVKVVRTAVDAMRLGACDYVTKPFDAGSLDFVLRRALNGEPRLAPTLSPNAPSPRFTWRPRVLFIGDVGIGAGLAVLLDDVCRLDIASPASLAQTLESGPPPVAAVAWLAPARADSVELLWTLRDWVPAGPLLVRLPGADSSAAGDLGLLGVTELPAASVHDLVLAMLRALPSAQSTRPLSPAVGAAIEYLAGHYGEAVAPAAIAARWAVPRATSRGCSTRRCA